MFPILYEKDVTSPDGMGLGMLVDCTSCIIKEVLNGEYSLEMVFPLDGKHADEITEGRLIYALRDNEYNKQLFRINEIQIDYIARQMTIYAPHVSRDLRNLPAPQLSYMTYPAWQNALNAFQYYGLQRDFTFYNSGGYQDNSTLIAPGFTTNVLDMLIGSENGIAFDEPIQSHTNGEPATEIEFDNFSVKFWKERGTDKNIEVRYGKNLTALTSDNNISEYPFGLVPFYLKDDGQILYGDLKTCSSYDATDPLKRQVAYVDFTSEVQEEIEVENARDSYIIETMNTLATYYKNRLNVSHSKNDGVLIDFEYLDLAKAAIYWSGARPEVSTADVGDYVTVVYENFTDKSEIVEIEYDSLKERYNKLVAGQIRATLANTIKQIAKS